MGIFDGVLIASDLDGTLLDSKHNLSEENREAVLKFCKEGGMFAAATGRSPAGIECVKPWEFTNAPAILSNGGIIYDYKNKKALFIDELKEETKKAAFETAEAFPEAGVEVICFDRKYCINRNSAINAHLDYVQCEAADINDLSEAEGCWVKILFVDQPEIVNEIQEWMFKRYGDTFSLVFSNKYMLELQNAGIDKGSGVEKLAELMKIDKKHVYTAGDHDNDLPMLKRFQSFAPDNAINEVKAQADYKLPHCDNNAIAYMIEFLRGKYGT